MPGDSHVKIVCSTHGLTLGLTPDPRPYPALFPIHRKLCLPETNPAMPALPSNAGNAKRKHKCWSGYMVFRV